MKTFSNNSMKLDNIITVSDVQFMVDDNTATQIYELLIKHFTPVSVANNNTVSAPKKRSTSPLVYEEKSEPKPMKGKKIWKEDFVTVTDNDKEYRMYLTVPIAGEKGKKIRYAIKASAKELGAKFAGNYDNNDFYWVFPTKKACDTFIKARKDYDEQNKK